MEEHADDVPVGRLLSRREAFALFGLGGAALLGAHGGRRLVSAQSLSYVLRLPMVAGTTTPAPAPTCVVRPEQTEGPYFVDEKLNRSDIRSDPSNGTVKAGVPLQLAFRVSDINSSACTALAGAVVDVWQCDALGVYSDVTDRSFSTVGQKFLRGYQVTDANGTATFTTIYPGWYQGRTVHIHFKIRTTIASGQTYDFTSQLYFSDALSDQVFTQSPYNTKGQRTTRNTNDGIYRNGGDQLTLAPTASGAGYAATFDVGLYIE